MTKLAAQGLVITVEVLFAILFLVGLINGLIASGAPAGSSEANSAGAQGLLVIVSAFVVYKCDKVRRGLSAKSHKSHKPEVEQ